MQKLKFKTNIHCNSCIQSVTPFLNQEIEIEHWEVNLDHPDHILTVQGDLSPEQVEALVTKAGFQIQTL